MEETNSTQVNSFEQAMNGGKTPTSQPAPNNSYSVNSTAESVLNVVAVIMLIVGVIGGLYLMVTSMEVVDHAPNAYLFFTSLLSGPAFFCIVGLLPWAGIKTVVNMSRNLHAIREELHELKNRR
jgi:hypothetical protein